MPAKPDNIAAERLASLGRAAIESQRFAAPESAALTEALRTASGTFDKKTRPAMLKEIDALLAVPESAAPAAAPVTVGDDAGPTQEILQQRASLELKLQTESARSQELQSELEQEQADHREAIETLSLQKSKLNELEDERSKLLAEISRLESQLRLQINETEQVQGKYEKLKGSRRSLGDQATEQAERINELEAENERLKQEVESTFRDRDTRVADAAGAVVDAEARTATAEYGVLWTALHDSLPDIFIETHVPTTKTFERLCEVFVELTMAFGLLESHVHYMLKQLKQVGERSDKLNHFHLMFQKNPDLKAALRDYLVSGKRKGYYSNLVRALQAWGRAFGTGAYKAVVRAPTEIGKELNYKNWPIKAGFTKSEDAAIGEYFRETAQRTIPDTLGTLFRKQIADSAYEDYDGLMKRHK